VRSKDLIRKVDQLTSKENPPSQNDMSKQLGVSRATVQRIIFNDLGKSKRKKVRVHQLSKRHMENRKRTSRIMYEKYLADQKSNFMVTLDEAYFYHNSCMRNRGICYVKKGHHVPSNFVYQRRESYDKKFMVVGAMSGKGVLPLIKVPPKVKVDQEWYIEYVLKPLLEVHVPALYGDEVSKVIVHHDQATSHTGKKTAAYAADLKART